MEEKNTIKVLLVDDSKLTLAGLNTTFKQYSDIEIVGNAENGEIALNLIKEQKPDVVLMDIGMPVMDGIQATREVKNLNPETKIIMLTSHESEQDVFDALSAGAYSYCMKDIDPEILVAVVKSTYNGASWLDPGIARIVLGNFVNKPVVKQQESVLTEREIDVLGLIAKGYSNCDISGALCISLNTVKTHIKNIFQKLEVGDRTQAAMKGLKEEIIQKNKF
ncbi:MAG: response regulator transcription factor [Candidatus Gastranaerophilales bacterium]|nr:response regulator transcription factor [Candidatus Gastranaerophilales bacterium]